MNTTEIAKRLVDLCREGKWGDAQKELYAQDAVSIEPQAGPAFAKESKGLAGILEKGRKFEAMVEKIHRATISDAVVGGNAFAISMVLDVTMKGQGRTTLAEVCAYTTKDGKITAEQFFM
ncbi:MAG TPA: nuclear transport factor 2 family protein [Candidatus Didemnitutus sp.]|jgi:hypothetical protein